MATPEASPRHHKASGATPRPKKSKLGPSETEPTKLTLHVHTVDSLLGNTLSTETIKRTAVTRVPHSRTVFGEKTESYQCQNTRATTAEVEKKLHMLSMFFSPPGPCPNRSSLSSTFRFLNDCGACAKIIVKTNQIIISPFFNYSPIPDCRTCFLGFGVPW